EGLRFERQGRPAAGSHLGRDRIVAGDAIELEGGVVALHGDGAGEPLAGGRRQGAEVGGAGDQVLGAFAGARIGREGGIGGGTGRRGIDARVWLGRGRPGAGRG